MKNHEFLDAGAQLSTRAGVMEGLHGYFKQAAPRLYKSCEMFNLFQDGLGDVLEIGPFYGYTPFILRKFASSYTVLEGDDPAVHALESLYKDHSVSLSYVDLFEMFGPIQQATHRLELKDSSFDTLLCWETMEHFAFNPVKFVREIHRVMKPGGRAYITVPNSASFQGLCSMIFGRGENERIDSFYTFENHQSNGKTAFYGFHWQEYTPCQLASLFAKAGFIVRDFGGFTAFHDQKEVNVGRKILRLMSTVGTKILPRFATNTFVVVEKP